MKLKNIMFAAVLSIAGQTTVKAQLAPLGSMYFYNQYQNNPALAGIKDGLEVNLAYRHQWSAMAGSPKLQVATLGYGLTDRAGLGINVNGDQTGLYKRNKIMATYAYHLPVTTNGGKLSFGVSLGMLDETVDYSKMNGDFNDPSPLNFNGREQFFDSDLGIAFTDRKLNLQFAMPNLRSTFGFGGQNIEEVDLARFFMSASYKIPVVQGEATVEPKFAFRSVKGMDNIFDAGANITFAENKVGLMVIYHSTRNVSTGVNVKVSNNFNFAAAYTSSTADMKGFTADSFEVAISSSLFGLR